MPVTRVARIYKIEGGQRVFLREERAEARGNIIDYFNDPHPTYGRCLNVARDVRQRKTVEGDPWSGLYARPGLGSYAIEVRDEELDQ